MQHLRNVLKILIAFVKLSQCNLWIESIIFLEHVGSMDGIMIDLVNIEDIHDWSWHTSPSKVCSFIGQASQYRRFIKRFSTITSSMTRLTWKEVLFLWLECESSFWKLKDSLSSASILALLVQGKGFTMCSDDFSVGLGCILMQQI